MNIVTLGCSFTEKYTEEYEVWSEVISKKLKANLINYGKSGSGNTYACHKLIKHILKFGAPDKVYWLLSEFDRNDIDIGVGRIYPIDYEKNPEYIKVIESQIETIDNPVHIKLIKEKLKSTKKISKVLSQTPLDFIIDSNLISIYQVQEICKAYDIELKIIQGIEPINIWFSKYDEKEIALSIISSRYVNLLDQNTIMGFPWMKILGGFNLIEKNDWKEKYAISEIDNHPNQEGHNYIAELFLNFKNVRNIK